MDKKTIENYQKSLALRTLAAAQQASNAANMSTYGAQVGEQTMAGAPLNISNIPMVAGLANRLAVAQSMGKAGYTAGVNQLKGLPNYIEGQRQYLRWRYPSRYGGSSSSQSSYWSPNSWSPTVDITLPPVTTPPSYIPQGSTSIGKNNTGPQGMIGPK